MVSFASRRSLILVVSIGTLIAIMLSSCSNYEFRGGTTETLIEAPDFTLTDTNGEPFRLSDHRGKVVMMFFGFTNCPDICPTSLGEMAAVKRQLGDKAENIEMVFVTVDPERDTPERLGAYVNQFDESIIGLHGTPEELEAVFKSYGVQATRRDLPDSAVGYVVDHTASIYTIDRDGMWRVVFPFGMSVEDIHSDIEYLAGGWF
ncbi:MAG: SCO family protein [Chloroflexi bacterium AL-W]|nr:SCO family protein [Chloroflexi bacterium AL-N1]NOK70434.1 SCO family protein [Chloroflexi bacterium AL-N10]NOK78207.1 SCO family protein [Chloroflexi bacterium AL-N5]NOK85306.1 SCO family protein [Chloroflexi bacterium AL-W]NOK92071.1 SCO family protein [Chloroflexi bacterium AL-N15]